MKTTNKVFLLFLVLLTINAPAQVQRQAAKADSSVQTFQMIGEITDIDRPKKRATIKHQPIKGYMEAMTMPFLIKDEKALAQLKVGDLIRARLVVTLDGATWVDQVVITANKRASTQDSQSLTGNPDAERQPVPQVNPYRDPAGLYTCPMHLNIRTKNPGKCPICGMELRSMVPEIQEEFDLELTTVPAIPEANKPIRLNLTVRNPRTGKINSEFALMHDRPFHLFVISQDMDEFQHIHPTQNADGSFSIDTFLPRAGLYKVYADFYPMIGTPQVLQRNLVTRGAQCDLVANQAQLKPSAQSSMSAKAIATAVTKANADMLGVVQSALAANPSNEMVVNLETGKLASGQEAVLSFHLTDAVTGQPVKDLIPFLGAWGHMLILSEDQVDVIHSHPDVLVNTDIPYNQQHGGPDLKFDVNFPAPGNYRIWIQFIRGRQVHTAHFDVKATRD